MNNPKAKKYVYTITPRLMKYKKTGNPIPLSKRKIENRNMLSHKEQETSMSRVDFELERRNKNRK